MTKAQRQRGAKWKKDSDEDLPNGMSRRQFLKAAAGGIAALGVGPLIFIPRTARASVLAPKVHPNIPGTRVVGITDDSMVTDVVERAMWAEQERLVNVKAVSDNMDKMACALADQKKPKEAWKAIFVKPPKKSWKETVVAIKTNQIASQRTRSAVMAKVCYALTEALGVQASNIFIYDACHGGDMSRRTRFKGLPEGCVLADQWGGSNKDAPVPLPWLDGEHTAPCLGHLVDGKVDILVNIALCKGHGADFGGFTMSMKNHFGTFAPGPSHRPGGQADYLIGINKSSAILGPMDCKTGKVLFPRQQLCIIDALWASQGGPGGQATTQPNSLFMGVLNPVLDYQVATHLRAGRYKWPVNNRVLRRFLREFDLRPEDLPNEGKIIDANEYWDIGFKKGK